MTLLSVNHTVVAVDIVEDKCEQIKLRCGMVTVINTIIIGEIEIGENVTIGAGSIVTHDIPPNKNNYNKVQDVYSDKK